MRKPIILVGVLVLVLGIAAVGVVAFLMQGTRSSSPAEPAPEPSSVPPTPTPTVEAEPALEPEATAEPAPVIAEAAEPPEPLSAAASRTGEARGYCVQLGAFGVPGNAERMKEAARAAGIEVAVVERTMRGERVLRVRTAARVSRSDAQAMAADIEAKLGFACWVTR